MLARAIKVTLARLEVNPRVFIQRHWQCNVIDNYGTKIQSNGTGGVNSLAYLVSRYLEDEPKIVLGLFQGSAYLLTSAP